MEDRAYFSFTSVNTLVDGCSRDLCSHSLPSLFFLCHPILRSHGDLAKAQTTSFPHPTKCLLCLLAVSRTESEVLSLTHRSMMLCSLPSHLTSSHLIFFVFCFGGCKWYMCDVALPCLILMWKSCPSPFNIQLKGHLSQKNLTCPLWAEAGVPCLHSLSWHLSHCRGFSLITTKGP